MSPFRAGLIAVVLAVLGAYFAYTKDAPFLNQKYELEALFTNANQLGKRSPVRIAGVNVGKVTNVELVDGESGLTRVTMEINDDGLPIHEDAQLKIRSRLFLEGNYFLELRPGTPGGEELDSGSTLPPNQTDSPVQFGAVLNALQSDTREDLRTLLQEYSRALQGSGAKGFNNAIKYWEEAYRSTSLVNDATLGQRPARHDLSRVLRGQARVFGALSRDSRALRDLVTNLNRTIGAFAIQEDNLRQTIPALRDVLKVGRPALQSVNEALPSIRAFARDALPGARSTSRTLDAQIPFTRQLRLLVRDSELRGLARVLRRALPSLNSLNRGTARTLEQNRALASCQNNVLVKFATAPIPNPDSRIQNGEAFYEEGARALVGLSGESRTADANTSYFRTLGGAGPFTVVQRGVLGEDVFAQAMFRLEGVRPARPSRRPVFRPNVPCETQEPPDLNAYAGQPDETVRANGDPTPANRRRERRARREYQRLLVHLRREARGLPSVDPLQFSELGERIQARRLGLRRVSDLRYLVDAREEERGR
jgi:virulence factor Mce-like protein